MFWVKNFNLNTGGIAGALIFVGAAIAIVCLISQNGQIPSVGALPFVLAAAAGGMVGNWMWNSLFPRTDQF